MFVPAWMMNKKYAVLADWAVAFGTLLASAVALWVGTVGYKREEWVRRRNDSILGAVIIETILEDVRSGLGNMERKLESISSNGLRQLKGQGLHLSAASWAGAKTIPDNVFLRIIATGKGVEATGFPPAEIRSRCRLYFVDIKEALSQHMFDNSLKHQLSSDTGGAKNYIAQTKKVVAMLEQTKALLEENAKRLFPK